MALVTRTAILLALVILFGGAGAGSGSIDPFYTNDVDQSNYICNGSWACNAPYKATTGRTQRNMTVNTGIRNLVLFVMGQSNNESEAPSAYTPTNGSAIDDLNIYDGMFYAAADPHLGTSYNSTGPGLMDFRAADQLITNGKFDRVILVPLAIGGTLADQHATGPLANLPCVAMRRLAARGITPSTTNVTFAADWGQGDNSASLTSPPTQIAYQAALQQIKTNMQACGFVGRFFVNVVSFGNGVTYSPVTAAQAAVVDNVFFFAGANLDSLNNSNRVDGVHFNDTGAAAGAALKVTAWHASGAPF